MTKIPGREGYFAWRDLSTTRIDVIPEKRKFSAAFLPAFGVGGPCAVCGKNLQWAWNVRRVMLYDYASVIPHTAYSILNIHRRCVPVLQRFIVHDRLTR